MWQFLLNLMESRIEKMHKSAESERDREASTSKNAESVNVSETFLEILKSSYEVKFLYEENKNSKTAKKMISAVEVKMKDLFQSVTTSTETGFDDIIVLAIAYYNLGELYFYNNIKLDIATDHFTRCTELLHGKELDCKAILIAIRVHLDQCYVWKRLEKLEKCYPSLDKAMELYLNYTKEEEYPYPIDIATVFHIHNITANSKIQLTELHIVTLELIVEQYWIQPRDKHKFVIYVHNLLNKELNEALNFGKEVSMYWSNASADLCIYFLHHDRFIEAGNHLGAADYMMEMHCTSMIKTVDENNFTSMVNNYELLCANIAAFWGVYGVFLLRLSTEKLLQCDKSCEVNNIISKSLAKSEKELMRPLIFIDLKEALEHIEIPNTYVSNRSDAKIILTNALKGLDIAKRYYTVDKNILTHAEIIVYISLAYKYYAYFVEGKSKIKIIKQRIKIFKDAVNNVISRCNTLEEYQYCKQFYFDLAIAYSTLLNITSEKLNKIEEITDEMRMETKQLVRNILDNFTLYLKNT